MTFYGPDLTDLSWIGLPFGFDWSGNGGGLSGGALAATVDGMRRILLMQCAQRLDGGVGDVVRAEEVAASGGPVAGFGKA
uniref:Uncharacterized protein n=1 Tax=Kalanchoe fedtschenkoi TaxID=63787 RepID=A0A7N0TC48_KALFE